MLFQSLAELLSLVGGTLGLYLGGSLFSIIELFIVTLLICITCCGIVAKKSYQILQ